MTVLYSSGDNGVAGNGKLCLAADGSQSLDATHFNPSFPGLSTPSPSAPHPSTNTPNLITATCPYITSVGATQVVAGHKVTDPESASYDRIFSGGGFSNYFAIPEYQKSAVQGFLANHPPPYSGEIFNATGGSRAFPDLSANGCVSVSSFTF